MLMSEKLIAAFTAADNIRDEGLTTPENVARYDDLVYGEDSKWNVLDVYRPKNSRMNKLPVIINIHGGGWVYGDKERYQFYCMSLVKHGFAVVNYTYRLAPEFKFPASLEDTNDVFHWVQFHAEKYGFDLNNVYAVGDSAGANLLGIYSNLLTNPNFQNRFDFILPEIHLNAIALNSGQYKFQMDGKASKMEKGLMSEYLPEKGSQREMEIMNIIPSVTQDFPPTFLMTANGDFLRKQPSFLIDRFIEQSVPFEFHFYGNKENELGHVFHCDIRRDEAEQCNKEECDREL